MIGLDSLMLGRFREAEAQFRQALATWAGIDGVSDEERIGPLGNLAIALQLQGDYAHAGEFHITAEPLIGGHPNVDAVTCTRELLGTLASLPAPLKELFDGCHRRVFDYGFDGGSEAAPCSIDLPAVELSSIARMGIDLRVTVYPHRT